MNKRKRTHRVSSSPKLSTCDNGSGFISFDTNGSTKSATQIPFRPLLKLNVNDDDAEEITKQNEQMEAFSFSNIDNEEIKENDQENVEINFIENDSTTDSHSEFTSDEKDSKEISDKKIIDHILCEPSKLQEDLYEEIGKMMTLNENEQNKLFVQCCNHPMLCYQRVKEITKNINYQNTKKAKREFVNYSGVLCKFPTGYESTNKCSVKSSGKLKTLFNIITATKGEEGSMRLIILSNYIKTLIMLEDFTIELKTVLNFSTFRINANEPRNVLKDVVQRIEEKSVRNFVLINYKALNDIPFDLFNAARVILYDFDPLQNGDSISHIASAGAYSIQRLFTKNTLEEEGGQL